MAKETKMYTFTCPESENEVRVHASGTIDALAKAKEAYERRYRTPVPRALIGQAEGVKPRLFNFH